MTILQRLKDRKKELKSDLTRDRDALKYGTIDKQLYQELKNITDHRIDELDYIIIVLKEEGIIPETKKDKQRKKSNRKLRT